MTSRVSCTWGALEAYVSGGTANSYAYAVDPINQRDLDGRDLTAADVFAVASMVVGFLPAAVCPVCGLASAALGFTSALLYKYVDKDDEAAILQGATTTAGLVLGGVGSAARLASMASKMASKAAPLISKVAPVVSKVTSSPLVKAATSRASATARRYIDWEVGTKLGRAVSGGALGPLARANPYYGFFNQFQFNTLLNMGTLWMLGNKFRAGF